MTKTQKKLKFLFLITVSFLIFLGIYYVAEKKTTESSSVGATPIQKLSSTATSEEEEEEEEQKLKETDYIFARPSNGTLVKTQKIQLQYNNNGTASTSIPLANQNIIRANQNVILYNKENTIMPLGGKVREAQENKEKLNITISLPKNTKTNFLSTDAAIITMESLSLQRFPLSALQYDKNENAYVWVAETKENKVHAIKTWIDNPLIGDDYFLANSPITAYTHLILNPDEKIQDRNTYKMEQTTIDAPLGNPIEEAYRTLKNALYAEKTKQKQEEAAACGTGGQSKLDMPKNDNKSCGQAPIKQLTPEELFQSILSRQPNTKAKSSTPTHKCGSCGS